MAHRILIVDGDELECHSLQTVLHAAGFEVVLATGEDAMERLDEREIHLVLTERCLPRTDGFSLLWCIKADHPSVPVVVMTTDDAVASIVEAMRLGAEDYLVKPFDRATLLRTIERAIASGPWT